MGVAARTDPKKGETPALRHPIITLWVKLLDAPFHFSIVYSKGKPIYDSHYNPSVPLLNTPFPILHLGDQQVTIFFLEVKKFHLTESLGYIWQNISRLVVQD